MTPLKIEAADWERVAQISMEKQKIDEFVAAMDAMTGRELYDMETLSLMNRFLIDRPISRAFRKTIINYDVEPIDIMRSCLIDGFVFLRVDDIDHIRIEKYVSQGRWDLLTDELMLIETKYLYFDETRREDMYHIEHWKRNPTKNSGIHIVYQPVDPGNETDERKWIVKTTTNYPVFPYVGIRWIDETSFLIPLKASIIRLEAAYRTIGAENIERMGLSLFISGIRSKDDILTAPRKFGRRVHIIPEKANFANMGTDAPGMELMIHEVNNLQGAIEKASCVVAAEKLAVLSGISRSIAEEPLNALAEGLRDLFESGMLEVYELAQRMGGADKPLITYRPLKIIEDKIGHMKILDRAVELNAISYEEEIQELRLLLELSPELRTPVSPDARQRLQDKEQNNDRNSNSRADTGAGR